MDARQYNGLMNVLDRILDRMPVRVETSPVEVQTSLTSETDKMAGARLALMRMLAELDGWIESARENHQSMGHRGENTGDECWRSFAPQDIRDMVDGVARQFGMSGFDVPDNPQEDKPL
jgi:hypothetical protein